MNKVLRIFFAVSLLSILPIGIFLSFYGFHIDDNNVLLSGLLASIIGSIVTGFGLSLLFCHESLTEI